MKYKSNSAERQINPRHPAMSGQMAEFHFSRGPGLPTQGQGHLRERNRSDCQAGFKISDSVPSRTRNECETAHSGRIKA